MTQTVFDPIDPVPTSGVLLASLLNALRLSLLSGHSGSSRPAYAQAGTCWVKTAASPWIFYFFDGSHDLPLCDVNATTGVLRIYHAGEVLGALALKNSIASGDIGTGAVLTDALGAKAVTQGKLGDASVGALQIKTAEKADILSALLGTATNGRVVKGNGTTFELALPQISVASDDTAPGYLSTKFVAGSLLTAEVFTDSGVKKFRLKIANATPNSFLGFDVDGNPAVVPRPDSGIVISRVVFTSSGTYTKPDNLLYADVEVVGGGGGAGGYSTGSAATAGGTSSFGAHCSATGGGPGTNGGTSTNGNGGTPGVGTGGDINSYGGYGQIGSFAEVLPVGGEGGASFFGGGGRGGIITHGISGLAPGSGGGGGAQSGGSNSAGGGGAAAGYSRKTIVASALTTTETVTVGAAGLGARVGGINGGYGATGIVIVTEYRSA